MHPNTVLIHRDPQAVWTPEAGQMGREVMPRSKTSLWHRILPHRCWKGLWRPPSPPATAPVTDGQTEAASACPRLSAWLVTEPKVHRDPPVPRLVLVLFCPQSIKYLSRNAGTHTSNTKRLVLALQMSNWCSVFALAGSRTVNAPNLFQMRCVSTEFPVSDTSWLLKGLTWSEVTVPPF